MNRELAFLKRVFNVAIAAGEVDSNAVRAVKLLKENNQRVRFLTTDEESRRRKAISEDEWPNVAFALNTGVRRANQFRLR